MAASAARQLHAEGTLEEAMDRALVAAMITIPDDVYQELLYFAQEVEIYGHG